MPRIIFGQSASPPPKFEAAVVKINKSGQTYRGDHILPSGQFNISNSPLREIIMWAYHVQLQYVTRGPGWIDSDRFDIVAKAPPDTTMDVARLMLRSLLADRFKLRIRQEQKVLPVFALTIGKSGPRLRPPDSFGLAHCGRGSEHGIVAQHHVRCTNMTLSDLAEFLPDLAVRDIGYPVVDLTGIKGSYDFDLDFRLDLAPQWDGAGRGSQPDVDVSDPVNGPTIFEDLDTQFGLRLEAKKQAMPVIVVEDAVRVPEGN
jgi:uncharacterized protein (TIGR03435 family)